jgi:D-lactate dehydrogenase (cytochrome)
MAYALPGVSDSSACSTLPLSDTPAPDHDVSASNISSAADELVDLLGPENVVSSFDERLACSSIQWNPASPRHIAALIVYPGSTSDVSGIVKICSRRHVPIFGYSGGTSFCSALTATRGGICIDFKRMNKVLAVHPEDMDAVVQPTVGWQELNAQLETQGLFFPPDPGPGAKIGGMVRQRHNETRL